MVEWAPMSEYTKGGSGFIMVAPIMKTPGYFLDESPWTQYEPARTGAEYTGEITYIDNDPRNGLDPLSQTAVNITERTLKAAADKYPEIMAELKRSAGNKITIVRNAFRTSKGELAMGLTRKKTRTQNGFIKIAFPYNKKMTWQQMIDRMTDQASKMAAAKKWSSGKFNSVINHELGHLLQNNLSWRGGSINTIITKAADEPDITKALAKLKKNVSKYSGEDVQEAFSELFAKSMDQDATSGSKYVQRFIKALDEENKKYPDQKAGTRKISV